MELSSVQIAKLVLGYLKLEKCQNLYNDFLNSSPYLKEFNNPKKKKYIVTRVLGQSLVDILKDYAVIYTIIQERLEASNFYNEQHSTNKLSHQLVYLLDGQVPSRTSSPISNCRSSTPNRNVTHSPPAANISEIVPDVNATPLNNLPGNSDTTPKRRIPVPSSRSHRLNTDELDQSNKSTDKDGGTSPEVEKDEEIHIEKAIEAFAQTLLEHQELQEKIARNINSVRHSDGEVKEDESEKNDDIDKAIKAVLEKTESDPAFESLIGDIIGTVSESREEEGQNEAFNELCEVPTEKNPTNQTTVSQKTDLNQKLSVNTNSGDITIYHGTMENYITNDNLKPPTSQPIMLNPSNLLLMTTEFQQNRNFTSSTTLDPTKPLLFNNQIIFPNPQPQSFIVNKILTEQDILTMPTVIVTEEKPKSKPIARTNRKKSTDRKLRNLMSKSSKENMSEYLRLNKSGESEAVLQLEVIKEESADATDQSNKSLTTPLTEVASETCKAKLNVEGSVGAMEETKSLNKEGTNKDTQLISQGRSKSLEKGPMVALKNTPDTKSRKRSVSTPRSGNQSHVRALDFKFETPAKEKIIVKRAGTSPKVTRKSPTKAASKSAKTLFGSPAKNPIKKKKVELRKSAKKGDSWDADLRALANSSEVTNVSTKKKLPLKKRTREDLNKTEDDAMMIEAAILQKTPEERVPVRRARSKSTRSASAKSVDAEPVVLVVKNEDETYDKSVEHLNLRNCNTKAKFKRKCNIDNGSKKDVKVTAVKEIKNLESSGDKLVLSPSRLNANKRSLVDIDEKKGCGERKELEKDPKVNTEIVVESLEDILPSTKSKTLELVEKEVYVSLERVDVEKKFLTPEIIKNPSQIPSTSRNNVTPMLETPVKDIIPKTPGFFSPVSTNDTPFTKVFKEQIQGIDLNSIPTPKFPLTPNFPFTPLIETQSPYTNRPTDYSTSSSYYQPSDTEQNKSLELLIIEECKRLENKKTPGKEETIVQTEMQSDVSDLKKEDSAHKVIADKMKSMSSNVIARKNLSLVKRKNVSSEESSSSESESDSSDDESSSSDGSFANETVLHKTSGLKGSRDSSLTRYALRSKDKVEEKESSGKGKGGEEKKAEGNKVDDKVIESEMRKIVGEVEEGEIVDVERVDGEEKDGIDLVECVKSVLKKNLEGEENVKKAGVSPRSSKSPRVCKKVGKSLENIVKDIEKKAAANESLKKSENKVDLSVEDEGKSIAKADKVLIVEEGLTKENVKATDNFIKSIIENTNFKPQLDKVVTEEPSFQEKVLKEMEEKRKRTIAKFKSEHKNETEVEKPKCRKPKPVPVKRSLRRNSRSSKDDNEIQPFQVVETEFSEKENDEKFEQSAETTDRDAENLVKGLKQWGIHLVHNKSPKTSKSKTGLEKVELLEEVEVTIVEEESEKGKKCMRSFEEINLGRGRGSKQSKSKKSLKGDLDKKVAVVVGGKEGIEEVGKEGGKQGKLVEADKVSFEDEIKGECSGKGKGKVAQKSVKILDEVKSKGKAGQKGLTEAKTVKGRGSQKVVDFVDEGAKVKGKGIKILNDIRIADPKTPKTKSKISERQESAKKKVDEIIKKMSKSNGKEVSNVVKSDVVDLTDVKASSSRNEGTLIASDCQKESIKVDNLRGNVEAEIHAKNDSTKKVTILENLVLNNSQKSNAKSDSLVQLKRVLLSIPEKDLNDSNMTVSKIDENVTVVKEPSVKDKLDSFEKADSLTYSNLSEIDTETLRLSKIDTESNPFPVDNIKTYLGGAEDYSVKPQNLGLDSIYEVQAQKRGDSVTVAETKQTLTLPQVSNLTGLLMKNECLLVPPVAKETLPEIGNESPMVPRTPKASQTAPQSFLESEDLTFDTTSWINTDNLDLVVVHDENSTTKIDYDLTQNDRVVTIGVYIEQLDLEVDKYLTVSPFHSVLDHRPINILIPKRKPTTRPNPKKKPRPLNTLYTELIGEDSLSGSSTQGSQHSPLDELYDSQKTSYGRAGLRRNKRAEPRNKSVEERERKTSTKEEEEKKSVSTNKRKGDELEAEGTKKMKTENCQELLKDVNVDAFLKKLHG